MESGWYRYEMKTLFYRHRRFFIGLWHVAVIVLSLTASYLLRFDFSIPRPDLVLLYRGIWIAVVVKLAAFHFSRLDRGWWRFVSMTDLMRVLGGNAVGSSAFAIASVLIAGRGFPRSVYLIDFLICFLATAGGRASVRLYYEVVASEVSKSDRKGLLIYGAGMAGLTLLKEVRANPSLGYHVIGFLDDDARKRDGSLLGIPVVGAGRDAPRIVDRYRRNHRAVEEIIIAMPSATGGQMREALSNCRAAGVACQTIPSMGELLSGRVLSGQIRQVAIGDLLGREPVRLEEARIRSALAGRSILITGAAGSIGSELCRQVAQFKPRILVAFDQAESDLFKIDLDLRQRFPSVDVVARIGDIRDPQRVQEVIRRHQIDSVFHAAAYKHVPMMEAHVLEAVKNNILGTWNLVHAAHQNGVAHFLMISSDKAVRPTNIMGVTKRVAELIVSSMESSETKFVSVRFGNVLGSNGSVVPLFQQQIAAGGPVTVTHPEVRRYFMTVREAVQLVLQASTMGEGSETFVLDMGEPIKIADLAKNMIRLSARESDKDVEIRYVGLRPGEKLYEELITDGEDILPTYHEKIKIFKGGRVSRELVSQTVLELEALLDRRDEAAVVAQLKKLVPEYQPGSHWANLERHDDRHVQAIFSHRP